MRHLCQATFGAYACCALYAAKNSTNAAVISNHIEARLDELLRAPSPTTPLEHLAHTQALLLYYIMRAWGGDLMAGSFTADTVTALDSSFMALLQLVTFDDPDDEAARAPLPLYPLTAARDFWDSWVFMESGRRTLLVVFYFLQLRQLLGGEVAPLRDCSRAECQSLTLSAHLWSAADAFEFAVAWREKDHFLVNNRNVIRGLEKAKADDIDTMGKILITSMIGIDETKGWLAVRGAVL